MTTTISGEREINITFPEGLLNNLKRDGENYTILSREFTCGKYNVQLNSSKLNWKVTEKSIYKKVGENYLIPEISCIRKYNVRF